MSEAMQPAYDVPWGAVRLMLVVSAVALVVLLIIMLLAWRGWWPFNKRSGGCE